jgi:hypothetical protein
LGFANALRHPPQPVAVVLAWTHCIDHGWPSLAPR